MTPFDPGALLVMLLTFYPIVSVATLQRARAERPEYFAAGQLGGSKGEKLTLPDGRVFDLIFAAGAAPSVQRWQAIDVTNDPGTPGDGLTLDPGPLAPLDDLAIALPRVGDVFESLVSGELAALDGADGVLQAAAAAATDTDLAASLGFRYAQRVEPAIEAHGALRAALEADNPIAEVGAADEHSRVPGVAAHQYADDPPPDLDEPDPGTPPGDDEETPPGTRHPKDEDL